MLLGPAVGNALGWHWQMMLQQGNAIEHDRRVQNQNGDDFYNHRSKQIGSKSQTEASEVPSLASISERVLLRQLLKATKLLKQTACDDWQNFQRQFEIVRGYVIAINKDVVHNYFKYLDDEFLFSVLSNFREEKKPPQQTALQSSPSANRKKPKLDDTQVLDYFPVILAKSFIMSGFISELKLPGPSDSYTTESNRTLFKNVCNKEYLKFRDPLSKEWLIRSFFPFSSLTSLELCFCDDAMLAEIGEHLWSLKHLKLHLTHFCSDYGLLKLMNKVIPVEFSKLRQMSSQILALGEKPRSLSEDMKSQLLRARLSKVDKELLESFEAVDRIRGCQVLESLTFIGDVGCVGLTPERTTMFECGLHVIMQTCERLSKLEISSGSSDVNAEREIQKVPMLVLRDLIELGPAWFANQNVATMNIDLADFTKYHIAELNPKLSRCKEVRLVNAAPDLLLKQLNVGAFSRVQTLTIFSAPSGTLQKILASLSTLANLTFGVDSKASLRELVGIRRSLSKAHSSRTSLLSRLHVVFQCQAKTTFGPNWLANVSGSVEDFSFATGLTPNPAPSALSTVFGSASKRESATEFFLDSSKEVKAVLRGFALPSVKELTVSGAYHWAQALIFGANLPALSSLKVAPVRDFEVKRRLYVDNAQLSVLPFLLALDPKKLVRLVVEGASVRRLPEGDQLVQFVSFFAQSADFTKLSSLTLRGNNRKLDSIAREINKGHVKNCFTLRLSSSELDADVAPVISTDVVSLGYLTSYLQMDAFDVEEDDDDFFDPEGFL